MKPLFTPVLTAKPIVQQQVYQVLLSAPDREWTVPGMATELPAVPVNDLRIALHLLLGDGLMDIEPSGSRSCLTLRLTRDGRQTLAGLLEDWPAEDRDGR